MRFLRSFGLIVAWATMAWNDRAISCPVQERLFGVRSNSGCCWQFERISTVDATPDLTWNYNVAGVSVNGFGWTGERLITYSTATNPDRLATFHPANAAITVLGSTGINNSYIGRAVERDPISGVVYVALPDQLYRASTSTGALTFHALFTGFKAPWDRMNAMGIRADGSAFVIGANDGASRYGYYELDLSSAQLNWIADIHVAYGHGYFRDVAISSTGDIWASYAGSGVNPFTNGVYKIDPNSLSATKIRYMADPYYSLAFVPGNVQTTYCVPKASSTGCLPSISADGFPSPTASSGYWIRADRVRNQTLGTLAFSLGARAALPFGGGALCLTPPLRRTGVRNSGGAPTPVTICRGVWLLDFNTWMAQNGTLPAGTTVRAQWLGRDPGFAAPNNWSISDALEFDLRP